MTRRQLLLRILLLAAVLPVAFLYPFAFNGPVLCAFRRLTGVPCPFCGMTRAFVLLAHGNFLAALRFNAFAPLVFVSIAALLICLLIDFFRGTDHYRRLLSNRIITTATLSLFALFFAARMFFFFAHGGAHAASEHSLLAALFRNFF